MGSQIPALQPHVLALPFPIPGHINPLLHLCRKLASLGIQITYVNSLQNHKAMFNNPSKSDSEEGIEFIGIPDGVREGEQLKYPLLTSAQGMRTAMEDLVASMIEQGTHISCIISDIFMAWSADLAKKFELPRVAFCTTSASFDMFCLHLGKIRSEGFIPVQTRTTGDRLIDFIPGMPPLSPDDIPIAFYEEHPIIDMLTEAYGKMSEASWILSGTFEDLEIEVIGALRKHLQIEHYLSIGPFLPDVHLFSDETGKNGRIGLSDEEKRCLEWLDSRPESSVLYVAFGSVAILSAEQFEEFAYAIESSGQSFLWAIRPNLVENLQDDFFNGLVERTKDRGHFVAWASQMEVLRHPAVAGFVTHCGWNSAMESVCAGVPMIGWPCNAEQNLNCKFLVEKKLALRIQAKGNEIARREPIAAAIEELMNGDEAIEMRRRIGALKDAVKKAVSEGGSSARNFDSFVKGFLASVPGFNL